ncbi:MAG: holin [Klebsiella oxytoca]|nr:holin [Klebsiella oxytoca]
MQDKESIAGMSWLVLLIIACWGGLVRYLIDVKVIAGLVSIESGLSIYMILATAGISGAMGSVALTYFWERLTGIKDANQ